MITDAQIVDMIHRLRGAEEYAPRVSATRGLVDMTLITDAWILFGEWLGEREDTRRGQ